MNDKFPKSAKFFWKYSTSIYFR